MKRKKIVAGNWKMNTSVKEAIDLAKAVVAGSKRGEVTKIFFPPFPYLLLLHFITREDGFYYGAQNCSEHEGGAYTGEVSASMISSVGGSYVIIGHSERRSYFKETDEQLVKKIQQALKNNIHVIFCFGELPEQRKSGKHFETVRQQLFAVLKNFSSSEMSNIVLAYEPVWAIGTGETATPQQAQEMHAYVRQVLTELFDQRVSSQTSILYGGSCNAQNARELFSCPDVDGGLIGGASLKAEDFCKIIGSFS
jgi:triosephosphate isomerase